MGLGVLSGSGDAVFSLPFVVALVVPYRALVVLQRFIGLFAVALRVPMWNRKCSDENERIFENIGIRERGDVRYDDEGRL